MSGVWVDIASDPSGHDRRTFASKLAMACGWPSSHRLKSCAVSPRTGRPAESSTTASTVTSSVRAGNVGTSRRS